MVRSTEKVTCVARGLVVVVLSFLQTSVVHGDSLWQRRTYRAAFLFEDTKARRVGDLLTIIVDENTDIENREERELEKSTASSFKTAFEGQTAGAVTSRTASLASNLGWDSGRSLDGEANYRAERDFSDRITVTVVEVLPNGNLVVEGSRRRVVANEERVMHVSGVVRPDDIGPGNVIRSQFVANFNVWYEGRGVDSHFINPGFVGRLLNKLWPF
jgi:flagellar L-ring protein precursor FlgH